MNFEINNEPEQVNNNETEEVNNKLEEVNNEPKEIKIVSLTSDNARRTFKVLSIGTALSVQV
jgi:hypothetical protein